MNNIRNKALLNFCIFLSVYSIVVSEKNSNYIDYARKLYENVEYQKSIDYINKHISSDTTLLAFALNLRGICHFHLSNFDSSLIDLTNSIVFIDMDLTNLKESGKTKEINELNNLKSNTYFNRGLVLQELNRFDEAIISYNYVIINDINNKYAYFNQGFIYYQLNKLDSAIACFSKVINIDPTDMDAVFNRANIYYELKDCRNANHDYNMLIANNRSNEYIYFNLANCFFNQKEYTEAIKYYNLSLKFNKIFSSAYYNRAQSYLALKKYKDALQDLNSAIKFIDNDKDLFLHKTEILAEIEVVKKFIKK